MLARLDWQVRRAAGSALAGDYRSVFRGRGVEFEQLVKYQWGDDPRDVDWNVTARLGEPYRKQWVEERATCVLLVFEDGPELQFGSVGKTRRDTLLEAAVLLMLMAQHRRDGVGLIYTSPDTSWWQRPAAGRDAIRRTAERLLQQPAPALDGAMELESPWRFARRAAPGQSVLVWLGAFTGEIDPDWSGVAQRYQTIGLRADDPWDEALPQRGPLPLFDPVAGCVTEFDPRSGANRAAHAAWAARREEIFAAYFPAERSRHALRNDESVCESLREFFHRRARA
jgi:uncharacterized protein (DUF58 family)